MTKENEALTPRHEAPADPCKSCNGTGRELGSAFNRCADCEAPAEGAGEAMTEREVRQWIDACNHEPARQVLRDYLALRARSSAPEAREGVKTLGWFSGLARKHGHHAQADWLDANKHSFTQPAAPSADKLRITVEAMQGAIDWDKGTGYRTPYRVRCPIYAAIYQALAALKAEGA